MVDPKVVIAEKQNAESQENEVERVDEPGIANEPLPELDFEKLMSLWNEYALECKASKKLQLYSTLTKRTPTLIDGHKLLLVIDNKVQDEEMVIEKQSLLTFLREKMSNFQIDLITEIEKSEESATSKPYTIKDKFEKMAEEYPILHDVKKIFDLNVEN